VRQRSAYSSFSDACSQITASMSRKYAGVSLSKSNAKSRIITSTSSLERFATT
jgi:hypothetical protein